MGNFDPAAWAALGLKPTTTPVGQPSSAPSAAPGAEDYRRVADEIGLERRWVNAFMGQETSGGRNVRDSVQGARGALQITKPRFFDAGGKNFDDPEDVMRTSVRELQNTVRRYNGNPQAVAGSWHSGDANVNPDGSLKNPSAIDGLGKRTTEYQADIGRAIAGGGGAAPVFNAKAWAALGLRPAEGNADSNDLRGDLDYSAAKPKDTSLPTRNAFAVANDTVINLANSVVGLVKTIPDLVSPGGTVSAALDRFIKFGESQQSDRQKALDAQLRTELQAKGDDEWGKTWAYVRHAVVDDPLKLVAQGAGNIAPFALLGGSLQAARLSEPAIERIAMMVGGAMGAGEVRGNIYDKIQQIDDADLQRENPEYARLRATMTEQQAKREFGARFVEHLPELAVSAIVGAAGGKYGLEALAAGVGPKVGRLGAAAIGFGDEALQGGVEQLATNFGVRRALPSQRLGEDVGVNMAAEGFAGGIGGFAVGGPGAGPALLATPPAPSGGADLPATVLVKGVANMAPPPPPAPGTQAPPPGPASPAAPATASAAPPALTDVAGVPGMEPGVFPVEPGPEASPPPPGSRSGGALAPSLPPVPQGFGVNPPAPSSEAPQGLPATRPPVPSAPPTTAVEPASPSVQTSPNAAQSKPSPAPDTDMVNPISAPPVVAPARTPVDRRARRMAEMRRLNEYEDDLLTAIAKLGGLDWERARAEWGLDPEDWKKAPRPVFGMPVFRKKGGRLLDDMAEALYERGYLDVADLHDLFDKFDRHVSGRPVYTPMGYENVARRMAEEQAAEEATRLSQEIDQELLATAIEAQGQVDPEDEAVEAMGAAALLEQYSVDLGEAIVENILERAAIEAGDGSAAEFDAIVLRLIKEYTRGSEVEAEGEAAADSGRESAQGARGEDGRGNESDDAGAVEATAGSPDEPAGPPSGTDERNEVTPDQTPAPAGVSTYEDQGFALTDQTEAEARAEARMRQREEEARSKKENAPPPEEFSLTGSNRPTDVAASRGAQNIPGLIDGPVDKAAHEAATSPTNDLPPPTEGQIKAGNYQKGHVRLLGLDISIENPAGSTRSGTDANGKAWSVTMKSHYGYIRRTESKDGDHIDVFAKPGTPEDWTGPVFVVDQTKGNGHFDEHKVMLGFATEAEARAAYLENYTKGWDRFRAITETTPEAFKAWLRDGDTTKAFAQREENAPAPTDARDPVTGLTEDEALENFNRQQEIMKSLPSNIGKLQAEGKIGPERQARLNELNALEKALPSNSAQWSRLMAAARAAYDQNAADAEQRVREKALADLNRLGFKEGDRVKAFLPSWLPGVNGSTRLGVVKIGKRVGAYVLSDGEQLSVKANPWELAQEDIQTPAAAPKEAPAPVRSPDMDQALKDAQDALGDLADIFGKNLRANLTPEQEQKLLPVLTRLFDAAFRAGYYSFRDAARWVLEQIRARIGPEVAEAIDTEHLQGAYIGMSGRHKSTGKVTPAAQVVAVEKGDIEKTENNNAERSSPPVERNRQDGNAGDGVGAEGVPNDRAADPRGARTGGRGAAGQEAVGGGDSAVSGDEAAPPGVRGDLIISAPKEPGGTPGDFPGSDKPGRGSDVGGLFGALDPNADAAVDRAATRGADLRDKIAAQREANKLPVKFNDRANIDATLPFLLEGQREDVAYAEARWAKPDGYGVLFTNGTGTGKTFLALGAARRMVSAGKSNGIIVVPDQTVLNAWVDSGIKLGLEILPLGSTTDPGRGVAITTYANFGANPTLADRPYDFVIMDEAHNLKVGQQNEDTTYLLALRAITMHPDGTLPLAKMIHRDLYGRLNEVNARLSALSKAITDDMMDAQLAAHRALVAKLNAEAKKLGAEWAAALGEVTMAVASAQGAARPRAMFLSATPFAYDLNVDWANGYLFEYGPRETGGYNTPSPPQRFMMTHFGYQMRYGKLTKPPKEVNTDLMERTFNSWLRKAGVLSSRTLDVPFDYDRRFVAVESLIGRQIDEAMEWLRTADDGAMSFLREQLTGRFDYLSRARLLEALKAAAAVDYIKKHHALGRKVVVWYDFNEGGGFDAFKFHRPPPGTLEETSVRVNGKWERAMVDVNEAITKFEARFPDLVALKTNLPSPLETLSKAFPHAVQNNGITPKKTRLENIRAFNDDARPDVNIILVQSAANAGWSGHDTTGKHMRVTVNLGLPTQPHKSIQQEGRTYRVGQMSDTSHTYFNTGTTWEVVAFAQKIARRAGTVENLANGEQARGLADAFIQAFESSEEHEPGPSDGKGGKAADRDLAKVLDEFDRAIALYYANEKKNSRNKATEGTDYFATPEPLGLVMVRWANPRPGDSFLEPSAGHGAIARFFPEQSQRVLIEESPKLAARAGLAAEGDIIVGRFEDYHIVNKFSVIVMNPPFGVGGKVAIEHLAKAARHLKDGGRIVALIPRGPAADKRLDNFLRGTEPRPVKPLTEHPKLGAIYKGDTVKTGASYAPAGKAAAISNGLIMIKVEGKPGMIGVPPNSLTEITARGPRTEEVSLSENLYLAADILLPTVTFERAGTGVATRIVVLEKQTDPELAKRIQQQGRDYTGVEDIKAFFERIRESEIRPRVTAAPKGDAAPAAAAAAVVGTVERNGLPIVEHVTGRGKTIRGIIRADLTQAQAKGIDAFTFKKDGGWFIREQYLKPEGGPLTAEQRRPDYNGRYEADLFGNPLPANPGNNRGAGRGAGAARPGNVDSAAAVPGGIDLTPGDYRSRAALVETRRQKLGAKRVKSLQDAANALAYLRASAVERLDAVVTDDHGTPLAVIGGFKGAVSQTSVYPGTLLGEAIMIPGARHLWMVHNHPSGTPALSDADRHLTQAIWQTFSGTRIHVEGIVAVTASRWGGADDAPNFIESQTGDMSPSDSGVTVPAQERQIISDEKLGPPITGPQQASKAVRELMDRNIGRPTIVLLDAQNSPIAAIPWAPQDAMPLRDNGKLDALIRAVATANAAAAIIGMDGLIDTPTHKIGQETEARRMSLAQAQNLGAGLARMEIRVLDIIDRDGKSAAERGLAGVARSLMSRRGQSLPSRAYRGTRAARGIERFSADYVGAEESVQAYSRGIGPVSRQMRASIEDLDAVVSDLKKKLPGAPTVLVAKSYADPRIPRSLARRMEAADAEGAYLDGKVYLVAPHITGVDHAQGLLSHEVLHAALDLMGDERSQLLMSMRDGNERLRADAAALRARFPDMGELESVEEALAEYAREGREPTLLQRWAAFLRDALRHIGFTRLADGWTDGEVLRLVADAPRRAFGKAQGDDIRLYAEGRLMRAAPIFYSKLADEIARKGSTAVGGEWIARIAAWVKAGAVKADEVEWSGIKEWLATQGAKVTTENVLAFLRDNGVRVEEVMLGGDEMNAEAVAALKHYLIDRAGMSHFDAGNLAQRAARRDSYAIGELEGLIDDSRDYDRLLGAFHEMPPTKFDRDDLQLPGGTNYREVLLTLPRKETTTGDVAQRLFGRPMASLLEDERQAVADEMRRTYDATARDFRSGHWDQPNVLAHIRLNDRTDADGKRVLFVEELQSDWAQAGRKRGFADKSVSMPELIKQYDDLNRERRTLERQIAEGDDADPATQAAAERSADVNRQMVALSDRMTALRYGIPRSPFVTKTDAWVALALKRVIRMAAEEGYDAVAWTTGEQQAKRYDLSERVDRIHYEQADDGSYELIAYKAGSRDDSTGSEALHEEEIDIARIEALVGKEIAQKIANEEGELIGGAYRRWRELKGADLEIGGKGMRAFYGDAEGGAYGMKSKDGKPIAPIVGKVAGEMLRKMGGGKVGRFDLGDDRSGYTIQYKDGTMFPDSMTLEEAETRAEDGDGVKVVPVGALVQPGFLITPEMREKAMAGLPLFARGGADGRDREAAGGAGRADEVVQRTVAGGNAAQGWARSTRIRRSDGQPATVYRGASAPLEPGHFGREALGVASGNPSSGLGVWFSISETDSARYGTTEAFNLDIRNPLVVKVENLPGFDSAEDAIRWREKQRAKGHDGIIVTAKHIGGPVHIVAFNPSQVIYPQDDSTAKLSRANQNLAQPLSEARYTEADVQRAAQRLTRRRGAAALDAAFRVPMQALRLDKATAAIVDGVLSKLGGLAGRIAPQAWETAKAGLVDQYGLPQDVKDQRAAMQGRMRAGIRSSKHAIDALGNLTRAESRVLYEYINGDRSRADLLKADLPEESVKIIDLYQQVADQMGQEAVRLGQLDADAFERHRWAYVHRSYQKYALDMPEQAKVERSRALRIRGDQYKGRGMSEPVPMRAIQNVAPDWWGRKLADGQADKGLRGQQFIRFDRRKPVGEGTADLEGFGPMGRRGRILETHYWPADEAVPAMYGAWDRDAAPWEVRDTKGDKLIVARDFTQAERQAMGEVDEVRFGMAATLHRMIHDIEVGRMLEYLANRHGKTLTDLPRDANIATDTNRMLSLTRAYGRDEWVRVPESKIPGTSTRAYGALAGLYVPGPIWNDVRQIVNTRVYPLGETYADILRAWKLSKTALSLPVHMNNVMSNVLMADFHDVQARDVVAALDVIRHRDRPENAIVIERFEDAGGSEGIYSLTELQAAAIQPLIDQLRAEAEQLDPAQGMARASSIVSLVTQMRYREAFTLAAQSKPGKGAAWLRDKMTKAYQDEDLMFRLAAFIRAKSDGKTDIEAGRVARESFLNYQINAPWVNLMRSTAFPFFSFVYRAAPMMLDVAKNKPWKIVKWGSIMGLLNLLGYLGSGGDEDKERRLLPEEMAGRTILGAPKLLRMPWNDAHDSPVFLDVRRWIPVGDLVDWGQTHSVVPFFPQLMPGGPASLLFELALNKSAFTGKEITQGTDTAGEATQKLADYLYKSFAPNTPGVPFAYSTDRILQAGGGKTDVFGREQSVLQAISSSAGVKVGSYPLDVMQRNAIAKYRGEDEEIKANISKLQRELQRKGISPEEFEARLKRQQDKRRELAIETTEKMSP